MEDPDGAHPRMQRYWDKLRADPDDVFFAARDRREEIKEHIKDLQSGLRPSEAA
jgi:hypothetical protein